ncbi:MAG TPA: DUF4043 family protein [Vicinamibacterales bacterium]|nr:DUF4043 family protein [Vicinamibacterales bacterium]
MSETTTPSRLQVQQWDSDFAVEYIRNNRFARYMGTSENNVIQLRDDLTKKKGERVTLPFVGRADDTHAKIGNEVLEGAEQTLDQDGFAIPVDVQRTGFVTTEWEEQKNAIDLRNAFRQALKGWAMERMRGGGTAAITAASANKFGIIDNMYAFSPDNSAYHFYGDADETTVKDVWLANNADRVLFGAAKSNNAANDHSAALAQIDNTADKMTAAGVSLMKRMAKTASHHITPIRTSEDEEWFVLFAGSFPFRDLKADSVITAANREAWVRTAGPARSGASGEGSNPLFRDGDLVYDGVVIREVPEIPVISNGTINCSANFFCGTQAMGVVWARRTQTRELNDGRGTDYGHRQGVSISEIRGCRTLYAFNQMWGMGRYYTAAVADS